MKKHPFLSSVIIIFGLALAAFFSFKSYKEVERNRQIESEINNLKKEADQLKSSNNDMADKISYFETPEFKERIAKEKLNLQKEGESVAVVKTSPSLNSEPPADIASVKNISAPDVPNYHKWWNQFFSNEFTPLNNKI